MARIGNVKRETGETQIEVTISLDGTGKADVNTGIGFFEPITRLIVCKRDDNCELDTVKFIGI